MTMSSEIPSGKMPRRHSKEDWRMSSTIALLWRTSEWIVLLIYLLTVPMVRGYPQFEETNDLGNPAVVLKTMTVDSTNGNLYIGSVNRLYRLGSDLSELVAYDTGPVMDNVNCRPPPVECLDDQGMSRRTETDNINKLMLVHNGELLTCANVYQGSCQRRDLTTLNVIESYTREVVSNFEHGIAIGFIAPGPSGSELYTATPEGDWIRSGTVPTIARRLLEADPVFGDDPFDFTAQITIPLNTLEEANARAQYAFNISYVYGFSSGSHSYFVGSQLEEYKVKDSPQRAKIARVCHQDDDFYSYIELPLTCSSPDGSINYNLAQSAVLATTGSDLGDAKAGEDVLFVTFSASTGGSGLEPTEQSAVCMYPLKTIDDMIAGRRKECAMETIDGGITEIEWLGNTPCFFIHDVIDSVTEDPYGYCFTNNFNTPLGSSNLAVAADAVYTSNDATLTAIMATPYQKETVIFLGDHQGKLRKLRMTSNTTASLYETIPIDENSAVAQNGLQFDTDKDFIYVMTERKISKLAVENCNDFFTCEECIGFTNVDGSPYCGWCALERRCTSSRFKDCDLPDESSRWLPYDETPCQQISNVAPSVSLPITVPQEITLTVDHLPDLLIGQSYECVFELDDVSVSNSATISGNDLRCLTPLPGQLPRIPDDTDHIVAILSIRSTETNVKFVSTNHTFFQCSSHTRCLDCAASSWDCDWCTYGNICTHDTGGICPSDDDDTLIAGVKHQRVGPSRRGPSQCTQLEDHPEEVLLAAGVDRDINITVKNLPDVNLVPADSYECILYIEGKEQITTAERIGTNTIRCLETPFTYDAEIQELTSSLTLQWTWGGSPRTIDDKFGFEVTLFKCALSGPDCSRCVSALTTRHELRCGWCSGMCAVQDHLLCFGPWIREIPDEGVAKINCPIPIIHSIWPVSGPIEGNTLIEINGTNLGRTFSNIRLVTVAEQPCRHVEFEDLFVTSERLYCRTMAGQTDSVGDVIITVEGIDTNSVINDGGTTFTYRNPAISEFSPDYGPEAGGTMVTIKGNDLLTGRDIGIQIGNASCSFDRYSSSPEEVVCLTGPSYEGDMSPLSMTFDDSERRSSSKDYSYRGNPVIIGVLPISAFKAGGRELTVKGNNLDVVQTPQVVIQVGGNSYSEKCSFVNGSATVMTCTSPRVDLPTRKRRQVEEDIIFTPVELGFIMDGANLRFWSKENDVTFKYFEDPNYFPLEMNGREVVKGGPLQIKGERLNLASSDSDVTVYIGDQKCSDVSLGLTALTCTVPDNKPSGESTESGGFPLSVIQGNLRFDNIGSVRFAQAETLIIPILGSLIAVIVLLVVAGILLSVFYHRRQKKHKKIITDTKNVLLERIRNLKLEADRIFDELQAGAQVDSNISIKLSNSVTINLADVKIHYDQLTFGTALGQGEFGKVFLATLSLGDGVLKNVAVKTIKDNTDATIAVKFLEEAMIMKNFDHPNVLSLLGLTFDPNGSPLVLLPFMKNGDLRSFLLKDETAITDGQMLNFAFDGAKGMSYLSQQKFVHRDLAARNCMIDEKRSLKIADFGLSRDLHESDYYRSGDRQAKLPVKWMAPESLAKRMYSTQTDVWSFGVVLWEMFSRGSTPYIGIPNRHLYQHIISGNRMECPPQCPPEIYSIMEKCWLRSPKLRPSFQQIVEDIESVIRSFQSATSHDAVHLTVTSDERDDAHPYYITPISAGETDTTAITSSELDGLSSYITTISSGETDTTNEVQPSDGGNSSRSLVTEDAPAGATISEVQRTVEIEMVTRPQSHRDNPIYSNDSVVSKYRR